MSSPPPLLAIVGPTAAGKTELSIDVARTLGAEILCVDSTTVYRGMDAGTAKPTAGQRGEVPHHLIDVAHPEDRLTVAAFQALAAAAVSGIRGRGRPVLIVGGSGLYYRAVVDGLRFPGRDPAVRALLEAEAGVLGTANLFARLEDLDPEGAAKIEPRNLRRVVRALEVAAVTGRAFSEFALAWERYPPGAVRAAGISVPREVLYRRIERRAESMWPELLAETAGLLARGAGPLITSMQAIGYAEGMDVLAGRLAPDEARARVVRRTKALARRQMAWFRRDPRVVWFDAGGPDQAELAPRVAEYLGGAPRKPGWGAPGPAARARRMVGA